MRRPGQIRRRLRSEDGIALPVAMLATVIGLGFAAVVIASSVSAQRGDTRDHASEQALTAAESGANLAIQRQVVEPCEPVSDGWCEEQTGSVGDSDFSYWVKPGEGAEPMTVVAEGSTVAGAVTATRRVAIQATSSGGKSTSPPLFGAESVIGIDSVYMDNGAKISGNVGTNGSITYTSDVIEDCDSIRIGTDPGDKFIRPGTWKPYPCGIGNESEIAREERDYPPPEVPASNSNYRMFTAGGDTYTYSQGAIAGCGAASWQAQWCPTSRVLGLRNQATVVLGGSDAPYVFCKLQIEGGGRLVMAEGARVQIVFDSPENCGLSSGATQLLINNGGVVRSESFDPGDGSYAVPGFFFVGSDSRQTKITLDGGSQTNNFIIYAPRTAFESKNNAHFGGAVLAKSVVMHGGAKVDAGGSGDFEPDEEDLPVPGGSEGGPTELQRESFVECVAARPSPGSDPDAGC